MKQKRITIVGGGYAGAALARALDGVAEVQLIEPRDRFVHNVAAIRAVVDPSLLDKLAIPYDKLLGRGTVRQAAVASVAEAGVTLTDGTVIESDIVVVATGSHYAKPFKPQENAISAFRDASLRSHEALKDARTIAVIGGGAVGVELAGEIAAVHPEKAVTLIAATPSLMAGYSQRLSDSLVGQLEAMGVSLRLGTEIRNLTSIDAPFSGKLETNGAPIDADLIFPAIGTRPETGLMQALGAQLDGAKRVKVDPWLRPAGASRIFALGDAAATGDAMTIVAITRQVPWLAKTIKALFAGKRIDELPAYKPWSTGVILVPLGPKDGASVLPVTKKGMVLGRRTIAMLKGKDLFLTRYWKDFGYRGMAA